MITEKIKASLEILPDVIENLKTRREIFSKFNSDISSYIEKLREIKEKLEYFNNKFEKDIIEVAFVGLEKAGKSTLINAVIGEDVLPSDFKRTTYTTTQVQYDRDRFIEVYFYSEEEFLEEVFRSMLKDVDYPNFHVQTLDSVSLDNFERHFESLKNTGKKHIYEKYKGNLENDIKEIIEGRKDILKHLSGKTKKFHFSDKDEYKDYITHKHISRAVKEIKIYTNVLKDLENIIIYDLPGFDSPTFIHSKFTKEKIRKADAVVFVREAENPSIKAPEVNIINETREEDGTELKEKLFFFCNMVDKIPSREDFDRIKKDFKEEMLKYELSKEDSRIIYGSAKARLQKLGKASGQDALNGLNNLGLTDDGIDTLLENLRKFNREERRKILYKRVAHLVDELKDIAENVVKIIERNTGVSSGNKIFGSELRNLEEKVRKNIISQMQSFHSEVKKLVQDRSLSKKVSNSINDKFSFDSLLSKEDREKLQKELSLETSTFEKRPGKYNTVIRSELYKRVSEDFENIVQESVKVELSNISKQLNSIFLESFEISPENEEKFIKSLEDTLSRIGINFSYEISGLNKFIERFSGDLIQLMVQNPVGSQDRENKFKEIERDIYSLLAYDKDFDLSSPTLYEEVRDKLLYQKGADRNLLAKHLDEALTAINITLDDNTKSRIVKHLSKFSLSKAKELLNEIKDKVSRHIETPTYLKNYILNTAPPKEKSFVPPANYEEVDEEISKDLDILREMLRNSVVNALSLEKMVVNHITSQISKLKNWVDSPELYNFIIENASIVARDVDAKARELSTYEIVLGGLRKNLNKLLEAL